MPYCHHDAKETSSDNALLVAETEGAERKKGVGMGGRSFANGDKKTAEK